MDLTKKEIRTEKL